MLYKGSKKISPIINIANTIRNQNKTVNTNGVYTADEGYTGLGTVTVNVPYETDALTMNIEHNGTYNVSAQSVDLDGFDNVEINVNVPLQEKNYVISQADIQNATITINPDTGYDGMSSIVIDLSTIVSLLSQV